MSSTLPGLGESDALSTLTPADADRFRIVVTRDDDPEGPLEWGGLELIGVARHTGGQSRDDGTPDDTADPLDLARVLDRLSDGIPPRAGHWVARDEAAEAAIRWARIFHGVAVQRWEGSTDRSTYVDGLLYLASDGERAGHLSDQEQALDGEASALTQWARGEVYTVALERDAAEDRWESHEWVEVGDLPSLSGCYLEHGAGAYTAAACVADHWGVPRRFADAVPVVDAD